MQSRRETLLGALALAACAQGSGSQASPRADARFADIEARIGGRVGVAALNTGDGAWLTYRAQERFALCSTFKWLLVAQMLAIDMNMPGFREQRVLFRQDDLLEYAPVTRARIGAGGVGDMSVEELCAAAVVMSDNTAANLLLVGAGGPAGLTHFLRAHGDAVTRLDRTEPDLNLVLPGDERDTTTPDAMVRTMQRLLLADDALNTVARERLIGWMVESPTGRARLRAGLPSDWRIGDKTGTSNGEHNNTNDVAIAFPPGRAPIIIACYLNASTVEPEQRNAAHAEIARIVTEAWG